MKDEVNKRLREACERALKHEKKVIQNTQWEGSEADDCFALIADLEDALSDSPASASDET